MYKKGGCSSKKLKVIHWRFRLTESGPNNFCKGMETFKKKPTSVGKLFIFGKKVGQRRWLGLTGEHVFIGGLKKGLLITGGGKYLSLRSWRPLLRSEMFVLHHFQMTGGIWIYCNFSELKWERTCRLNWFDTEIKPTCSAIFKKQLIVWLLAGIFIIYLKI